jgi:hypothetical protein
MAGGMISGNGVPLRNRPVAPLRADEGPGPRVRHCWVTGPAEDPGPWPGLILEWRRDTIEWSALVVYAITAETVTTAVQTWVQQIHLRPA